MHYKWCISRDLNNFFYKINDYKYYTLLYHRLFLVSWALMFPNFVFYLVVGSFNNTWQYVRVLNIFCIILRYFFYVNVHICLYLHILCVAVILVKEHKHTDIRIVVSKYYFSLNISNTNTSVLKSSRHWVKLSYFPT